MDGKEWPARARVIAVHYEAYAVDVEYIRDRAIAERVPVMVGTASSNTGLTDLPTPAARDMTAVVDLVDGVPVVIGFLHQRTSQMLFDDPERRVSRHASDVYSSIDADGNVEFYHPSGTFVRVGVSPDHEDLVNANHDQNWAITRNTDKAVYTNMEIRNGGSLRATFRIDPEGNVTLSTAGTISMHADGDISIDSGTHIVLTAPRIDMN